MVSANNSFYQRSTDLVLNNSLLIIGGGDEELIRYQRLVKLRDTKYTYLVLNVNVESRVLDGVDVCVLNRTLKGVAR